jgi:hypothetical protein
LPNLLQTLGQSSLSGVLSVIKAEGEGIATVLMEAGRVRGAQFGPLRGSAAIYQLLERPFAGTFAFVSRQDLAAVGPLSEPQDVMGLIMEGVRRHDEWKQAAALVPDAGKLATTDTPSTVPPDEEPAFIQMVWSKAAAGTTALACEASIAADSYRVRRLLAHWVTEGSLKTV